MFHSQPGIGRRKPDCWNKGPRGREAQIMAGIHAETAFYIEAARYCDELIALKDGKLLTRGTPDQIMQGYVLKGIFGVEMGVFAHPVTGQPIGYVH
jgi:ABC-type cobalamin/Fe3+-siderophores transport system ATPase subunit